MQQYDNEPGAEIIICMNLLLENPSNFQVPRRYGEAILSAQNM